MAAGTQVRTQGSQGSLTVASQSIYEEDVNQQYPLGTRLVLGDRVFHYARNGSVALTPGLVCKSIAVMTSEDTVTVAHGIGTYDVDVTAASIVANQFAEGLLVVDEGTGVGQSYRIRSNDATGGAAGAGLIRVKLYDPLATAWAVADTDVTLIPNMFRNVILATVGGIEQAVGVPLNSITADYYFWLQTWGPCGVKVDAATGGGNLIDERIAILSANHAGQVQFLGTADLVEGATVVGQCMLNAADHGDDKTEPIYLTIVP